MGRLITIAHSRVRIFESECAPMPIDDSASSKPAISEPKQRTRLRIGVDRSVHKPQDRERCGPRPRCCRASRRPAAAARQMASTSAACVEIPLPPSPFTFRPITLSSRMPAAQCASRPPPASRGRCRRPWPGRAVRARASHQLAIPCRAAPHRAQPPPSIFHSPAC